MADSIEKSALPVVAIVGRPNVGKSSLFNLILGRRIAIVHEESGVTRDRIIAPVTYNGKSFQIIDTGGLGISPTQTRKAGKWDLPIREQVEEAIESADIIIQVADAMAGFNELDKEVANLLRASGKKIFFVANKADNPKLENNAAEEFAQIGFKKVYTASVIHSRGADDLLDDVTEDFPDSKTITFRREDRLRVAVAGRPNVGKSSLINRLLGENRVLVSDIPGTPRDAIDIDFDIEYHAGKIPATLIDTAGMRKKSKVDSAVEIFSMMRTDTAIKTADIVLFVIEASKDGVTSQDKSIAKMIVEASRPCIIVANKWDKLSGTGDKQLTVQEEIRRTLPALSYAPLVFSCALSGYNFSKLLDTVAEVSSQMHMKISTSLLNKILQQATAKNTAPVVGNAPLKMYYATMTGTNPPEVTIFVNREEYCHKNYIAYLTNSFREAFGYNGVPIKIKLKSRPKTIQPKFTASRNTIGHGPGRIGPGRGRPVPKKRKPKKK